eukprot:3833928-Rhodomonas_salina.4
MHSDLTQWVCGSCGVRMCGQKASYAVSVPDTSVFGQSAGRTIETGFREAVCKQDVGLDEAWREMSIEQGRSTAVTVARPLIARAKPAKRCVCSTTCTRTRSLHTLDSEVVDRDPHVAPRNHCASPKDR